MKPNPADALHRCRLVTAGILLSGLGIALVIYLTAGDVPERS